MNVRLALTELCRIHNCPQYGCRAGRHSQFQPEGRSGPADKDPEIQRHDSLQGCLRTPLALLSWVMTEDREKTLMVVPNRSALARLLAPAAHPTPPSSPPQGVCRPTAGTGLRFTKEAIILLLIVTIQVFFSSS